MDSKSNFFVCLWQLQKHNISSAPIFDAEKQEYVGLIDLLDMVTFALVVFEDRKMLYEREFLQHASGDLVNKPELNAHLISNMSARNRFVSVHPTDSIEVRLLAFHLSCVVCEQKTHRLLWRCSMWRADCIACACLTRTRSWSVSSGETKVDFTPICVFFCWLISAFVSQFDLIRHFATLDYKEMAHLSVGDWAVKVRQRKRGMQINLLTLFCSLSASGQVQALHRGQPCI